ncbi:MAG: di-trans,poly-cis-decaprenylcistransferase [Mariprofundaceae bacterium]|nr:di-trans,poly-cis-decaprenylcistransferase [Mariprofundaceae bacterium]
MTRSTGGALCSVPKHVAIIMDGNGRWAKQRGFPRLEGHRRGAERAREVVEWAADTGVKQISLYAFSTENWDRPKAEVRGLMAILASLLPRELPRMQKSGVRLLTLGDISVLPERAQQAVTKACYETRKNRRIDLILCLNYGGQQEIVEGVKRACAWACKQSDPFAAIESIDAGQFRSFLWRSELLPVDLLIRTGGEFRISNFHLWDAAYAEFFFSNTYWPDYSKDEFNQTIGDYSSRERRFGLTSEQVADE